MYRDTFKNEWYARAEITNDILAEFRADVVHNIKEDIDETRKMLVSINDCVKTLASVVANRSPGHANASQ